MAKRFKLRICRVIATTLQSCRSKDPSTLPQDPVPSFPPLSKFSTLHLSLPHHQSHRVSSAFISVDDGPAGPQPPQFNWQKEEKWHTVDKIHQQPSPRFKICSSSASCDADSDVDDLTFAHPSPPLHSSAEKNRTRRKKKKKNLPSRLRMSTSSADSGWFSSEGGRASDVIDEEEIESLVSSSLSLSPESSAEKLQPIRETPPFTTNSPQRRSKRKSVSKRTKRGAVIPPPPTAVAEEGETPARLSVFKKLIPCTVDGKVKESFAIVKRSEDPYEDFKSSMMDMVVEKQMFEEKDLEQLLQCFLSLNSRNYHGIIVEAFSEIWETIFTADRRPVSSLVSLESSS
ncbi:Transcription repressor OFP7 [Sesamum alatum]|uniref:Transcription repressor n=1 Tax=Sesamum alatum TaxID=300844 RepID=A0AAE1YBM4_9LAMI|nr:Transcription repressor OFP7 [Sesamum alatum]